MANLTAWLKRFVPDTLPLRGRTIRVPQTTDEDFHQFLVEFSNQTDNQLTPKKVINILRDADDGAPQDQAALFSTIQEKEPMIAAHLQTRKRAILAANWSVQHPDDGKAEELNQILKQARIHKLLDHLLDALGTGYAGAATQWGKGGATIEGWKFADPTAWIFDQTGHPAVLTQDGKQKGIYTDYPRYQWVYHEQKLKPGVPARGGLLRALCWMYFFKHFGIRQYVRFIERFGTPFMLAKVTPQDWDDTTRLGTTLTLLRNIGTNGVAAVKQGTDVELQDSASGSPLVYSDWFRYIDENYTMMILGQTATSGPASGFSKGQAQENVRQDLLESDCLNLMETVTQQVLIPLERFRYGTALGEFILDYEPPADVSEKASVVKTLADAGYKAKREWIELTFDIPLEDAPEVPEVPAPPPPQQEFKAFADAPVAKEEFIARLAENTVEKLFVSSEAISEFTNPVKAEIRRMFADIDPDAEDVVEQFSFRIQGFFDRYPAIYEAMDTEKFETTLKGCMLSAMVKGFAAS